MTELARLADGLVTEDQIDHLGHMNVRFYATRALAATQALVTAHGLDREECDESGVTLALPDVFTRHYREQLVGARLVVLGGVLSAEPTELRLHHELRNVASDELSATFVHVVQLQDRKSREPRPFASDFVESVKQAAIAWPDQGRPRTLDLGRIPSHLTLDEARARGLEMRKPRKIDTAECDDTGFIAAENVPELIWGGEPTRHSRGFPLYESDDGLKFGWATLESRHVLLETPRQGTRIQSFSAEVQMERKTSLRHSWVFDLDTERLLCTSSIVNLAFDIGARRAIEIPDEVRTLLEDEFHPDLR